MCSAQPDVQSRSPSQSGDHQEGSAAHAQRKESCFTCMNSILRMMFGCSLQDIDVQLLICLILGVSTIIVSFLLHHQITIDSFD